MVAYNFSQTMHALHMSSSSPSILGYTVSLGCKISVRRRLILQERLTHLVRRQLKRGAGGWLLLRNVQQGTWRGYAVTVLEYDFECAASLVGGLLRFTVIQILGEGGREDGWFDLAPLRSRRWFTIFPY